MFLRDIFRVLGARNYSPLSKEQCIDSSDVKDPSFYDTDEEPLCAPPTQPAQKRHMRSRGLCYAGLLLLVSSLTFYLGWMLSPRPSNDALIDTAWDKLRSQIQYIPYTFDPHFTTPPSPYMGPPNPDLDARWYHLAELRNFAVDYGTLVRANKTKSPVQWPGTNTYQAGLETFHQLHCLNYIRMYTYMDYYSKIDFDMLHEPLEERTEHKDHCIDVLRQHLMCAPDLNIYTFHWTKHSPVPFFDLATNHKCIDWDRFDSWAVRQIVHKGSPPKPSDDSDMLD